MITKNFESSHKIIISALFVIVFLVYLNSLTNGYVWDDRQIVVAWDYPVDISRLFRFFFETDLLRQSEPTPYYRPLARLSFVIDGLSGPSPMVSHSINIFLHGVVSSLLFIVVLKVVKDPAASFAGAVLFAVHPVNSETVAMVATRNNLLSGLFVLLSIVLLFRFIEHKRKIYGCLTGIFIFLALLCKETAIAILPLIPVMGMVLSKQAGHLDNLLAEVADFSFMKRCGMVYCRFKTSAGNWLIPFAAASAAVILYLPLRYYVIKNSAVTMEIWNGLFSRLAANLTMLPEYFSLLLWPHRLAPHYLVPQLSENRLLVILFWLGFMYLLYRLFRMGITPATSVGMLWMLFFWLPMSGLVAFPSARLADRYLYLPMMGLALVLASLLSSVPVAQRKIVMACFVVVFLLFGARTVVRNMDWKDNYSLFSKMVAYYPNNPKGHHNLGTALLDELKQPEAAKRSFQAALAVDPSFQRTRTQLGYIGLVQKDYGAAEREYRLALEEFPGDGEAVYNLALVLETVGKKREAIDMYRRFIDINGGEFPDMLPAVLKRLQELEAEVRLD